MNASARLLEGMGRLHQLAGCPAVKEGLQRAFGEQGPPGGLERAVGDHLRMHYLDRLHIHVSGIHYSDKGERHHLVLQESDLKYEELLKALKEYDVGGTVVCESPNLEEDAALMKKTYESLS